MYSGYQMADKYVSEDYGRDAPREQWRFLDVADASAGKKPPVDQKPPVLRTEALLRHLRAGSQLAFKVWHLHPALNAVRIAFTIALGVGALCGLIYLWRAHVQIPLDGQHINLGKLAGNILVLLVPIGLAIAFPVAKAWINRLKPALNPGSIISRILFALVMASVGWLLCGLHLLVFDKLFLRLGRVRR